MTYKPTFQYPLKPEMYAPSPVPTLKEWEQLWASWDNLTQQMIPKEELLSKPIKLRNACIFYLGHIPTFLDIHLTRATKGALTEPASYPRIFERGIDPDVDNPEKCHVHSEIPDEWPPVEEVLAYQGRVRERVKLLYASGAPETDHRVKRAIWVGFEHEVMHIETLLYMLVQSEKTRSPLGAVKPDFKAMAREAETKAVENQWFDIPARTITVGLDDDDKDTTTERYFGWDNEKPRRTEEVPAFVAKARPITNGDYAQYMEQKGIYKVPASWTEMPVANGTNAAHNGHHDNRAKENSNGAKPTSFLDGKAVRTVFGAVPLKYALEWPVMASYDELASCAKWMGGRIPTMEEARSIYEYVGELKKSQFVNSLANTIPAVNRYIHISPLPHLPFSLPLSIPIPPYYRSC
jgi:L-histidine Nalpha-methyltransferase / hercynylcysteine S-oxide synthase